MTDHQGLMLCNPILKQLSLQIRATAKTLPQVFKFGKCSCALSVCTLSTYYAIHETRALNAAVIPLFGAVKLPNAAVMSRKNFIDNFAEIQIDLKSFFLPEMKLILFSAVAEPGTVAKWLERLSFNSEVEGSSPDSII